MTSESTPMPAGSRFRRKWDAGEPTFGLWVRIPSAHIAELAHAAGYDYVCVDLQHGLVDERAMVEVFGASRSAALARVAWNEPWLIMRALDLGAAGVIVPLVGSRQEAARAVQACRYPPSGTRSYGPVRAQLLIGSRVPADLAREALCFVMIETREGLERLEEIASTPGVDGIYVGPSDLSLALGITPGVGGQPLEEAITLVRESAHAHSVVAGIQCAAGTAARARAAEGFKLVTVGVDSIMLESALSRELDQARGPSAG
jgi:4-hydroxy-2-oxoheptanedioate aldolase